MLPSDPPLNLVFRWTAVGVRLTTLPFYMFVLVVLYASRRCTPLNTTFYKLLFALGTSDLVQLCTKCALELLEYWYYSPYRFKRALANNYGWPLVNVGCILILYLDYVTISCSTLILFALLINRFHGITRPAQYKMMWSDRRCNHLVKCIWMGSFVIWAWIPVVNFYEQMINETENNDNITINNNIINNDNIVNNNSNNIGYKYLLSNNRTEGEPSNVTIPNAYTTRVMYTTMFLCGAALLVLALVLIPVVRTITALIDYYARMRGTLRGSPSSLAVGDTFQQKVVVRTSLISVVLICPIFIYVFIVIYYMCCAQWSLRQHVKLEKCPGFEHVNLFSDWVNVWLQPNRLHSAPIIPEVPMSVPRRSRWQARAVKHQKLKKFEPEVEVIPLEPWIHGQQLAEGLAGARRLHYLSQRQDTQPNHMVLNRGDKSGSV